MKVIVILILTFMNGSVVQKDGVIVGSQEECRQTIVDWVKKMKEKYKDYHGQDDQHPQPSTFVTGCSQI